MTDDKSIKRKSLNKNQLDILNLAYKFRYLTAELLTNNNDNKISKQCINKKLNNLLEQNYLERKYDSTYKLAGKPAIYYLSAKERRLLKEQPDKYDLNALRKISRDKHRTNTFVDHQLGIFTIYNNLKQQYKDDIKFFTQNEILNYHIFPDPLPDAYIKLKSDKNKHCFLESLDSSTQFFVIRKRIRYLKEFIEDNDLPKDIPIPKLLFITDTEELKNKVQKETEKTLDSSWIEIRHETYTREEMKAISPFS